MKAARICLGLFVICAAALGVLVVFEVIDSEKALKYGTMVTGGLVFLILASAVIGMIGGGDKGTEPPPQL